MTYIIAEMGTGHEGSKQKAKEFVSECAQAGADAVKFQLFVPREELFCPLEGDENRWARWNQSALTLDEWRAVRARCQLEDIDFMASVFQKTGVEWLKKLQPSYWKVASRAAMTFPYRQAQRPVLISNGMVNDQQKHTVDNLIGRCDKIKKRWLWCQSKYPTPIYESEWPSARMAFKGLSDHSGTIYPGLDAMARGCHFLEVHVANPPPDDVVSISWDSLKLLCEARDAFAEMRSGS